MVIDAPFDPEPETCSRPRIRLHRGEFLVGISLMFLRCLFFFSSLLPPMLLVNTVIRSKKRYPYILRVVPRISGSNYNYYYYYSFFIILSKVQIRISNNPIHLSSFRSRIPFIPILTRNEIKSRRETKLSKIPIKAGDFGIRRGRIILSLYLQRR